MSNMSVFVFLAVASVVAAQLQAGDSFTVPSGDYAGETCYVALLPPGTPFGFNDIVNAGIAAGVLSADTVCDLTIVPYASSPGGPRCPPASGTFSFSCTGTISSGGHTAYVCPESVCSSGSDLQVGLCTDATCTSFANGYFMGKLAGGVIEPQAETQTPVNPGLAGDPILVDFVGHRFMGGARSRTDYLLYRSQDETEAITMTTGVVKGAENGFFAVAVAVERAGCGSLRIAAGQEHMAEITGDACMTARIARGDEGMVLVPIGAGGDAGSVLAVYPHQQGDSPAFVNMRLLATTPAFRAGCSGMLCNEAHEDVE